MSRITPVTADQLPQGVQPFEDGDMIVVLQQDQAGKRKFKSLTPKVLMGANAPQVMFQYSVNGVSQWSETYNQNHAFIRISTDDGQTWFDAMRFRGLDAVSEDRLVDYSEDDDFLTQLYEELMLMEEDRTQAIQITIPQKNPHAPVLRTKRRPLTDEESDYYDTNQLERPPYVEILTTFFGTAVLSSTQQNKSIIITLHHSREDEFAAWSKSFSAVDDKWTIWTPFDIDQEVLKIQAFPENAGGGANHFGSVVVTNNSDYITAENGYSLCWMVMNHKANLGTFMGQGRNFSFFSTRPQERISNKMKWVAILGNGHRNPEHVDRYTHLPPLRNLSSGRYPTGRRAHRHTFNVFHQIHVRSGRSRYFTTFKGFGRPMTFRRPVKITSIGRIGNRLHLTFNPSYKFPARLVLVHTRRVRNMNGFVNIERVPVKVLWDGFVNVSYTPPATGIYYSNSDESIICGNSRNSTNIRHIKFTDRL